MWTLSMFESYSTARLLVILCYIRGKLYNWYVNYHSIHTTKTVIVTPVALMSFITGRHAWLICSNDEWPVSVLIDNQSKQSRRSTQSTQSG